MSRKVRLAMTIPETMRVRQAISAALRFAPGMFDDEQREQMKALESRICEAADAVLEREQEQRRDLRRTP